MDSFYQVFPCYLSDQEFTTINNNRNLLLQYLAIPDNPTNKKISKIKYYINLAIFELNNLSATHNLEGYRYNSYTLNNVCLKLSYIYQLIVLSDPTGKHIKPLSVLLVYNDLTELLTLQFDHYLECRV